MAGSSSRDTSRAPSGTRSSSSTSRCTIAAPAARNDLPVSGSSTPVSLLRSGRVGGDTVKAARAVGLLLGVLADWMLADPKRGHPVAGFGTAANRLERVTYRDSKIA